MIRGTPDPKNRRHAALSAAALGCAALGCVTLGCAALGLAAMAADPARDEAWEHAFPAMANLVATLSAPSAAPAPAEAQGLRSASPPADPSLTQELGLLLHDAMVELYGRVEDEEIPTTTTRSAGTRCKLDGRAFRQPFMDAVLTGPAFAAWEQPVDAAWLEARSGLGERRPLTPTADPTWGWRAELPVLKPGDWVVVLQPSGGEAVCVQVEVPETPPPPSGCPASGEAQPLCELVVALSARRYGEVPAMVQGLPDTSELRRLAVLGACAFGHRPGDLVPGTAITCDRAMRGPRR